MSLPHASHCHLMALLAITAASTAPIVSAQLITDSFLTGGSNYSTGNITGQNPEVAGFTGAWAASSNTTASVNPANLSFSNSSGSVATSGGSVFIGNGTGNTGRVFRGLTTPIDRNSGSTVYMSVMMQNSLTSNTTQYRAFELSTLTGNDGNRTLQVGLSNADFGTLNYGFRVNNNNTLRGDLGFSNSLTNFFVIKLVLSSTASGDSITVWGNPSDLGDESNSGAGVSVSGITLDNNIEAVRFAGFAAGSTFFDEVRIGDSWTAVTTVPEPSTWALLGASTLAFVAFHRYRRKKSGRANG